MNLLIYALERMATFMKKSAIKINKKKLLITAAAILGAALFTAAGYMLATNRTYTILPSGLPLGYTPLDSTDSYIHSFELANVKYYDADLHYKRSEEDSYFLEERSSNNIYSGTLPICEYYSTDCGYCNDGTQITCEAVETNKEYAIIHYFGTGVKDDGTAETVDDYWRYEIGEFFEGRPTYSGLLLGYTPSQENETV